MLITFKWDFEVYIPDRNRQVGTGTWYNCQNYAFMEKITNGVVSVMRLVSLPEILTMQKRRIVPILTFYTAYYMMVPT